MNDFQGQLKAGFLAGLKKAFRSYAWMCQIIIPISFLVAVLQWTGWLNRIDFLLNPLMNLLNLPPEAALPIVTGMLINLYAVIAIITVIPFTIEQMTLIVLLNLITHSLIMEGVVQHRSGINIIKASIIRVIAGILTVLVVSQFLGDTSQSVVVPASFTAESTFMEMLKSWGIDLIGLLLKILGIILAIMIMLETLRCLGWIDRSLKFFQPLMKILGLSEQTTMMWVTAAIFGLLYGGAVIVEEAKNETLTREELERLHISIGITHGLVEDTALFAVLGINVFWLLVPRLIMAIIVVQLYRGIRHLVSLIKSGNADK